MDKKEIIDIICQEMANPNSRARKAIRNPVDKDVKSNEDFEPFNIIKELDLEGKL